MKRHLALGTQAICDLLINGKRFVTYRFITTLRVVVKADDDANLPINRTSGIRAFIDEGCCSIKLGEEGALKKITYLFVSKNHLILFEWLVTNLCIVSLL